MAIGSKDADPESREEPPKDRYRPLRMVSLKVLQSVMETELVENNASEFLSAESSESKKLSLKPLA
ncbi:hypothetical protein F2Q69_00022631 [Brassica cretica]|uniref:Uncharacterized protein n=1 Tax=Brassica cretica TaxID=69181 RepID=A0A8S9Q0B2_BRACR|nr:hypothetical protein F2Q69_00022631 [Brassica cretica]